jgi:hypothetical protein
VAKIAPVNIPVTVDPTGMDRGIAVAEQKLKAGATRMQRAATGINAGGAVRGVAGAGASALGFGAAAGAFGALGGAGLALGAIALPFFAANKIASALESATAGASEQLRKFNETGDVGRFGNQQLLQALSRLEEGAKARAAVPGFGQAFFAGERIASQRAADAVRAAGESLRRRAGAFFGGIVGGADIRGALDLATLSQLGPGPAADLFAAQMMREVQASRTSAGQPSARSAPITAFYDVIVEGNILNAQKLAEYGL